MTAGLIAGAADRNAPGMLGEESSATLTGPDAGETMDAVLAVLRTSGVMESITGDALIRAIDAAKITAYSKSSPLPNQYWSLDPIDGTKGFIKGRAYAVCLALIDRGQPSICALACPKLSPDRAADPLEPHPMGCLVLAERIARPDSAGPHHPWGPVWSVPFAADGSPDWSRATAQPPLAEVPSTAAPRWTEGLERSPRDVRVLDQVMQIVGGHRAIAMDSQAKYATVSRGQSDVYLRPAPRSWGMHVWDHAAGVGLCQAAGRLATDLRGRPVEFSTGYALSGQGMLVAPPGLQTRILEALAGIPDAFAAKDWVP
jgi:3'(2'), 5'-bisphosphate nucleotidase